MMRWGDGSKFGMLEDYIADVYPIYAASGCKNWEDVFNFIKEKT